MDSRNFILNAAFNENSKEYQTRPVRLLFSRWARAFTRSARKNMQIENFYEQ